jgi:hypothetical protein
MHWRSAQSIDKMRRRLGGYVKSVCNARPSRGSNGSGSEQPVLWHMMATRLRAPLARATPQAIVPGHAKQLRHDAALAIVRYYLPPIIIVGVCPDIRRDLALLRQLDHVHRRRVSPRPA